MHKAESVISDHMCVLSVAFVASLGFGKFAMQHYSNRPSDLCSFSDTKSIHFFVTSVDVSGCFSQGMPYHHMYAPRKRDPQQVCKGSHAGGGYRILAVSAAVRLLGFPLLLYVNL